MSLTGEGDATWPGVKGVHGPEAGIMADPGTGLRSLARKGVDTMFL